MWYITYIIAYDLPALPTVAPFFTMIAPFIDLFRNKTSVLKGSKDATDIDT